MKILKLNNFQLIKYNKMKLILLIILYLLHVNVFAWNPFGPKTYDECILKNMKGTTNDLAAKAIISSCDEIFNPVVERKKCKTREMSAEESKNVAANAEINRISSGPYFSGKFYNGNYLVTIEEISIFVSGVNIPTPQEYKLFLNYPIQPKTSGSAGISIQNMPGKNFRWWIASLKTCQ